ncbi:MAG: FAD-dependent oxidoreductase, partial [Solirubrobacteraceae bacterium]
MADSSYDCIVIGSGPGGYVAAIRAAQLGLRTAVVESDQVGGRCLNYACIPAKAVLRVADVLGEIRNAGDFGITVSEPRVDFDAVGARRMKVIKTLTGGVSGLLQKNAIDVIEGHASVTDEANVKVGGNFDGTEIAA